MLDAIKHIMDDNLFFQEDSTWRSTSFLLNNAPNSLELNTLITRFKESCSSMNMSHESKRLKKSSSNWLNSVNALIQHLSEKCEFRVS